MKKNGYTINLSQAGKYTEQEVRGMDSFEHASVSVEVVDAQTAKIIVVPTTVGNLPSNVLGTSLMSLSGSSGLT